VAARSDHYYNIMTINDSGVMAANKYVGAFLQCTEVKGSQGEINSTHRYMQQHR